MSTAVKSATDFAEKINAENVKGKQVIVDFWAAWCGPCRAVAPILDRLVEENKDVELLKVDVDDNAELSSMFNVQSIPTLMFFKDGQVNASPIIGVASQQVIENHFK